MKKTPEVFLGTETLKFIEMKGNPGIKSELH